MPHEMLKFVDTPQQMPEKRELEKAPRRLR